MIRLPRGLLVFVLAVVLARLAAAAFIPLSEDEAYYRLWAEHLQLGYYDHPPMIAWWVRAGMAIAGDDPLGVRLLPVLSSGLVSLVVFDIAAQLGANEPVATRAAVWFNATLLVGAGGALAVPDGPNMLFWSLSLDALARAERPQGSRAWWIGAGVAAGLATLSKYSALFLAPGIFLWLVMKPKGWRTLLTPWPWAAAVVAAALFELNLAWNAQHHWVTFAKQFGRAVPGGFAPQNLGWFLAGQLILITPSIAWFAARGGAAALRRKPAAALPVDLSLPLATSLPFLAYLVLHSLHDRVEAHWPAPLYPAIALIAAAAAESFGATGYQHGVRRRAAAIGLALSALVLLHLAWPATDFGVQDPALGFRGWSDFAQRIEALRVASHAGWVGTLSYGTTAELAASGKIKGPIVELRERDRYPSNDASWRADLGQPGLVVDLQERMASVQLGRCFQAVQPLAGEVRGDPGKAGAAYATALVRGGAPTGGDCAPRFAPGWREPPAISG